MLLGLLLVTKGLAVLANNSLCSRPDLLLDRLGSLLFNEFRVLFAMQIVGQSPWQAGE